MRIVASEKIGLFRPVTSCCYVDKGNFYGTMQGSDMHVFAMKCHPNGVRYLAIGINSSKLKIYVLYYTVREIGKMFTPWHRAVVTCQNNVINIIFPDIESNERRRS